MRLDKFVCKSTELDRKEAVRLINAGQVLVNGQVTQYEATQVHENNQIFLNNELLKARLFRYILIHKPPNTICSNVDEAYPSIFNCLNLDNVSELHVAGRLDADTTGLVLVTDDGRWSFSIIRPSQQCKKVYRVVLSRVITKDVIGRFARGIELQGESRLTLPAALEIVSAKSVILTINEGKFHQVKRMFSAVGNRVVSLHREQIGDICLDVEVGEWRYLNDSEVNSFSK
ncbi:MAG: 16S rRNA pseudouridine516 synthase [Oceanicoccus sp.]|jgi:16S rRNA pseudouridine516 synthase